MTIPASPAELEFGTEEEQASGVKPGAEEAAERNAAVEELRGQNTRLQEDLEGLKSRTAIINKLQEALGVKTEDPKDAYIRKEIKRLVPELNDVEQIKAILPEILVTLQAAAEEGTVVKASTAQDHMRELMGAAGLDPKDEDAVGYLEEALTKEIKKDRALLALWARGNVKSAVQRAFSKVESKLLAPVRGKAKRDAVRTITESPRAVPRGGAPSPASAAKPKMDFGDTSRDGVKKVHDAAFERLQELLDA